MASYYHPENYKNSESLLNVQELVKKPLASVPQRYIRLSQESPTIPDDIRGLEIPSIDIKQLVLEETNEAELEKLHSACRNWGIFQLVNHGLSSQMLEKLKNETEKFFNLPLEEKMKYKIRPGDVEGYGRVITSEDQRLDWSDRFYMTTNPLHKRKPHIFPELPSSLRSILDSYMVELQRLAMTLLGLLAKSLKMKIREMEELFEDGMQSVRMTYYPPCPQPELAMGITEHSDATGITILNQINGVDGLRIKKDGVWIPVKFQSDALVVNIGDILEIMSNGAYTSVEHRAMLDGKFNVENMRIKTEEAANAM
ncbi:hypothetical protein L6164_031786 [Bauhinia variegata]|uniref:Uncharacterized protein n=1 Tax=Bauhinia variegata TaxID=167791 RepID=A0ACB9KMC5_BAUVA|nr:hypothetical protein L6164_031786 [Bauhinia variegata]